jgi:hypothetical protein
MHASMFNLHIMYTACKQVGKTVRIEIMAYDVLDSQLRPTLRIGLSSVVLTARCQCWHRGGSHLIFLWEHAAAFTRTVGCTCDHGGTTLPKIFNKNIKNENLKKLYFSWIKDYTTFSSLGMKTQKIQKISLQYPFKRQKMLSSTIFNT